MATQTQRDTNTEEGSRAALWALVILLFIAIVAYISYNPRSTESGANNISTSSQTGAPVTSTSTNQ